MATITKAIVKHYPEGYCAVIICDNCIYRASNWLNRAEAFQVSRDASIEFLTRQANMYKHIVNKGDLVWGD
jgi:hypothetical protein